MKSGFLHFNIGQEEIVINFKNIQFIEISNITSTLFCLDNSNYTFKKPLSVIYSYLPPNFFQVNRSCVINLEKVITLKVNERKIILSNYCEVSISHRRIRALQDALKRNRIFTF